MIKELLCYACLYVDKTGILNEEPPRPIAFWTWS